MMREILHGNEAIARGALKANMKFFAGYPITPASEIMHFFAKQNEIQFIQTEDEISAINMSIGASLGGMKSMTATSGPGFSLMQEGLGLAHKLRVPLVVIDVQRVGPSTGMPTMPSQGDIMQSRYGSHGDYFPIVFYPNSVEECFKYTIEAFNASEESRTPVILLSDALLSRLYEVIDTEKIQFRLKPRRFKPLGDNKRHFTGLLSEGGIPRTRDTKLYRKWIKEMKTEIETVANRYNFYEYLENEDSDTLIISFGIASRVISPLKEKYSLFRPIRIFPVLENEIKKAAEKHDKIVVLEMNYGQYKNEIERILKRDVHSINPVGGRIELKEIREELNGI